MDLLYAFHLCITAFILFGFLFVPKIHAPFNAAVLAHWLTNNNRCILSSEYEDPNGYTKTLFSKIGLQMESPFIANLCNYALVGIPMLVSIGLANYSSVLTPSIVE